MNLSKGPPGSTWTIMAGNTQFRSTVSGWYAIGYKIDFAIGDAGVAPVPVKDTFSSFLLLNGSQITASGTLATAPADAKHQYSLANYILFQYTAGDILSIGVISDTDPPSTSVGSAKPAGGDWTNFTQATAVMTITQIA